MMSEAQLWDSNILRNLQQVSEARGLKFFVNPPREVVPAFLGNFQPDAIAVSPEGVIIIEVKLRGSPAAERQLAEIAKKVSDQKGWEFRAIYLTPPVDEMPPIASPTPEQLRTTFGEVEALAKTGHPAAPLVTAWAALEFARDWPPPTVRPGGQGASRQSRRSKRWPKKAISKTWLLTGSVRWRNYAMRWSTVTSRPMCQWSKWRGY